MLATFPPSAPWALLRGAWRAACALPVQTHAVLRCFIQAIFACFVAPRFCLHCNTLYLPSLRGAVPLDATTTFFRVSRHGLTRTLRCGTFGLDGRALCRYQL